MAILAVVPVSRAGVLISDGVVPAAGGDSFPNTERELLIVKNGGGVSCTVSLTRTASVDGTALAAKTVAVAAGEERVIGPFPPGLYNDANKRVAFTTSVQASVAVKVIKV